MPHWSLETKIRIVDRAENGWTHQQISETLGVPLSTVGHIIRDYCNRGTFERKKGSGRPQKMDERSKRHFLRIVEKIQRQHWRNSRLKCLSNAALGLYLSICMKASSTKELLLLSLS